eukprot:363625-Chlamydomonas_euryale.AAC.14
MPGFELDHILAGDHERLGARDDQAFRVRHTLVQRNLAAAIPCSQHATLLQQQEMGRRVSEILVEASKH